MRIQSRICIGGPALHSEILALHLPANKYRSILLGGAMDTEESCKYFNLKEKGIEIHIVPEMKRHVNFLNDILAFRAVYRIIKREKPDIIHTHTAKAGTIGRLAARLAGVPVIVHTFHGHVFAKYFSRIKTRIFILIEKFLARISNRIIAISSSQMDDLVERYRIAPRIKTAMIPLGFDLSVFLACKKSAALKRSLGIPPHSLLLGMIGRIVPIKNHKMALHALKLLLIEKDDVHLCVVGDGESRPDIENLAQELQIQQNVHFMGWITDIERIYAGIDILVQSSFNEGTPVTIIEAMAASVPVVSTAVGGVSDLLSGGKNGLMCASDDVRGLVDCVNTISGNKKLSDEMCKRAKSFVKSNYNYERLVREIDDLYSDLIFSR